MTFKVGVFGTTNRLFGKCFCMEQLRLLLTSCPEAVNLEGSKRNAHARKSTHVQKIIAKTAAAGSFLEEKKILRELTPLIFFHLT